MVVLGIDPGSRRTGWAVVESPGPRLVYRASGVLRHGTGDLPGRLASIHRQALDLARAQGPDEAAVESLVHARNVASLAKLAQARGALLAGVGEVCGGRIFEYAPSKVKMAVTGHGGASKEAVGRALGPLFADGGRPARRAFETDDESDALALAACHALRGGGPPRAPRAGRTLGQAFRRAGR